MMSIAPAPSTHPDSARLTQSDDDFRNWLIRAANRKLPDLRSDLGTK